MKNQFLYLVILMLSSFYLRSQSCEVSDVLFDAYNQDVHHLALVELEASNSSGLDFAVISQEWTDPIWEGLAAIYNADLPEKDEVFDEYCIHHNDGITLKIFNTLYVNVSDTTSWRSNWQNGQIQTNVAEIDSFFNRYGFELDGTLGSTFRISTTGNYNMNPIVDTIETFAGVVFSDVKSHIGGGDRISYRTQNGNRIFEFTKGWGDCPAGCILWYSWSFSVDENCNVTFLGNDWNNPDLPAPRNCNISIISSTNNSSSQFNSIEVYPNPTSDQLTIKSAGVPILNKNYKLLNSLGKLVKKGVISANETIDLGDLSSGVYFLVVANNEHERPITSVIKL